MIQVYGNARTELGTNQKLLLGFKKVTVASGQREQITIAIDVAILERYDVVAKKNVLNEKEITLEIGFSAADKAALKQKVRIDGPKWRESRLFDETFDVLAFDDYQSMTIDSLKDEGSLVQIKENGYLKYCQMIVAKNGVQLAIKATQPGTLTISDDLVQTNIIARFSYQAGAEFQTVFSEITNSEKCCDWVIQATSAVTLRQMQPKTR